MKVVTCNLGKLGSGLTETLTIWAWPTESGWITNTVEATAANSNTNAIDNTKTISTWVGAVADVSVQRSVSPRSVTAGEPLTYTITVHNAGPSDAPSVTLTDTLVADVPITIGSVNSSGTGNCNPLGGGYTITCTFGLDKNKTVTVTIVVTPGVEGVIINTASVTITASDLTDLNSGNNTDRIVTGRGVYLPIILKNI